MIGIKINMDYVNCVLLVVILVLVIVCYVRKNEKFISLERRKDESGKIKVCEKDSTKCWTACKDDPMYLSTTPEGTKFKSWCKNSSDRSYGKYCTHNCDCPKNAEKCNKDKTNGWV